MATASVLAVRSLILANFLALRMTTSQLSILCVGISTRLQRYGIAFYASAALMAGVSFCSLSSTDVSIGRLSCRLAVGSGGTASLLGSNS